MFRPLMLQLLLDWLLFSVVSLCCIIFVVLFIYS